MRVAAFLTNMVCSPDEIRRLYRRRWGIETGYRGINLFRGWTRSRWTAVRV
jgi:IS4 transposase